MYFKYNFIWKIFWHLIKLLFKVEPLRFYGLESSFSEVYYSAAVPISVFFLCEEFGENHFHTFNVFEISSTQEMDHRSQQLLMWWRMVWAVWWVWVQFDSSQFLNFWHGCSCRMGLALSYFKRALFRLTNAGYPRLKISWTRSSSRNEDPHRLHARLEQTSSESHLQNTTIQKTLLLRPIRFFNDDFGRLTGTEPLIRAWAARQVN